MNYLSFSGGKDSTALAVYLADKGVDYKLVFADTCAEFPETYWSISNVASKLGKDLLVLPSEGMFAALNRQGFFLPTSKARWCTRVLKTKPQDAFYKEGDTVFVGITADESHRLEGIVRHYEMQRPLVDDDIWGKDIDRLNGDLINPIYGWRSRTSCFCCPFQLKQDWISMLRNHPQFYRLAEIWEEESKRKSDIKHTWYMGRSLKEMRELYQNQGKLFPDEPHAEEPCAWCAF